VTEPEPLRLQAQRHIPVAYHKVKGLGTSAWLLVAALTFAACGSTTAPTTNPSSSAIAVASTAASPVPSAKGAAVSSTRPTVTPSVAPALPVESSFKALATISAPDADDLATDGTMLWELTRSGGVARLDPATNTLGAAKTVDAAHMDGGFAAGGQGVWLNDFDNDLVYRVDPATLKVVTTIKSANNPEGLAVDPASKAVWVADHRGGTVSRIDAATNKVVAIIKLGDIGPSGPHQIGLGLGSVWVGVPNMANVDRIDPATNKVVAKIDIPAEATPCSKFAFSRQAVWIPSCLDATTLTRIDPTTNKVVATIDLGGNGDNPITVDGFPWLTVENFDSGPGRLVRIDPATNTIDRVVSVGDHFRGADLFVADGSVWLIDGANATIVRLPLAAFSP